MHETHLPFTLTSHPKEALLQEMAEKMKPFLKNKAVIGEIYIIDESTPNACTIVGGNIYVTTGLLDNIASDDALAYIIGHEYGHNENNHTAENGRYIKKFMEYQRQYEEGGLIARLRVLLQSLSLQGVLSATTCFGQTDELEADLAGLYLAYHAGYDPAAALDAIKQLKEWEQPMPSDDFDLFWQDLKRSHPWAEDRYACAASYLKNYKIMISPDSIFPNGVDAMVNTNGGQLYVREYPNSPIILDSLDNGEIVRMVCTGDYKDRKRGKGKWIYVKTNAEVMGWAWGGYLQTVKTKPKKKGWFSGDS